MGYLEIAAAPLADFKKAIISIFFQASAETLNGVLALADSDDLLDDGFSNVYPALHKIIPLITFGSIEPTFGGIGVLTPTSPSFIGIDCFSPLFAPTLAVNLQMPNSTNYSPSPSSPEDQWRRDVFYMRGRGDLGDPDTQRLVVTPDAVHHALISFDLSLDCSCYFATNPEVLLGAPSFQITAGPTFSWAFDDVDKVGLSMAKSGGALWNTTPLMTPIPINSIVPSGLLFGAAGDEGSTATWSSASIASNTNPIGIPTSSQFVSSVYPGVVLGELQFFTGISADASDVDIRRLFIKADGTPQPPSVASDALGQAPDILLHGSSLWKAGVNTGSLGENFIKTGTINTNATALDITP